ncbi:unnamed protein product [Ilex paraguariensis]|uniref:Bulb-type lectin domain-containing protein n=1 Tax=Ilex paraguariensis TaxID=185542 RepID=A0ABC8SE16_9AQUA
MGIEATNYSYLGIWYTKDDQSRRVWVANPNTPIKNNSGVLRMDTAGRLVITAGGTTIVVVSDKSDANAAATLEDNGNFVAKF